MFRSPPIQTVGFTLTAIALGGFLLVQLFQCSGRNEIVLYDPREDFDPSVHPLLDAIYRDGSEAEIERLLDENSEWINKPIYQNWYAVHCAAQAGRPEVLQILLDAGADVHVLGGTGGANIVVSAFESEDPETLIWVLDAGVDPHLELIDGTPLEYIRIYGTPELNRVLDQRGLPEKSP